MPDHDISHENLAALASLVVECSEDAIVSKSLEGVILTWNRGATALYGYTAEEAIGKPIVFLLPPDRADEEEAILARIRTGQWVHHFETVRIRKDGTPVHVSLTISPIFEDGRIVGASHVARDISERKRLEAANAQLAAIVESSEDAILSEDLNGVIETWNASAERIYGYSAAEAVGRNISALVPHGREEEEQQILARIARGQRVEHFETVRLRKGGETVHVSLTISPMRNRLGVICGASHVAREIAERRRLESANAQLAAIVESSEDAIVSKDLDGIVQTWNAGAERLYGYAVEEAVGRHIGFLLPVDRASEEYDILSKIRRGERVDHFEATRLRKDGRLIDISLTISPIRNAAGVIVGASHVARDITARKALDRQMQQAQRLESIGVLAGGIAHDFNNLLTGIIGNASLIAESLPVSHPARERLDDLETAADRAADLTRQLLAYSGKGQFVVGPVNVSDAVAQIAALLKVSIPKTVSLRLELDHHVPLVEADQSQIQQLVMNLMINGAEAIGETRTGTVTVRTGAQQCDASYIRSTFPGTDLNSGEYVYIEVRDDGCGMDEEVKARIFDPFFTTKFTGRGLGLAAALGIVNAHKGAIRVSSALGQGSSFRVFLPAINKGIRQNRAAGSKGTILVADDEEIVRKVARAVLESYGFTVLLAANGKEAVELFRDMSNSIVLLVLDLMMPVMSGEEALGQLRALGPVPIVLSSGYDEAEAMRRFQNQGLAGFLQKPYTGSALRRKVDEVLGAAPRVLDAASELA